MTMRFPFLKRTALLAGLALGALAPAAFGAHPAAAAAPTISVRSIRPGGTQVTAQIATSKPTVLTTSVREVNPPPPVVSVPGRPGLGAVQIAGVLTQADPPPSAFKDAHEVTLKGLKSGTAYDLVVVARDQAGEQATQTVRFTTLKKRIRVTLESITITDDGDVIGSGEPSWFWSVTWATGTAKDCFPISRGKCRTGSYSETTVIPSTPTGGRVEMILAEENFRPMPSNQPGGEDFTTFPTELRLHASAHEDDSFLGSIIDALFDAYATIGDNGQGVRVVTPLNVESSREIVNIGARDGNFASRVRFRVEVFHDNATYVPNNGRVHSTTR